ncbi:hypothetical protein BAC3_00299 [uncultured bacterium]|nr:hypothetical protein BAC3_00299 [uncultured bacterium]
MDRQILKYKSVLKRVKQKAMTVFLNVMMSST